ncbi:hypothetical protein [Microtetraspora glauca]|uniref:Uncharacterized protein n=1 Tax=Microtetraspora glauca TaxID=1996 RepID=A0ABV3GH55_MICGL
MSTSHQGQLGHGRHHRSQHHQGQFGHGRHHRSQHHHGQFGQGPQHITRTTGRGVASPGWALHRGAQ